MNSSAVKVVPVAEPARSKKTGGLEEAITQRGSLDYNIAWLEAGTYVTSPLTMRYHNPAVEMEYVRYCYSNSISWHNSVVYGCLVAGLILVEVATNGSLPTTERFALIVALVVSVAAFAGLLLASWCVRANGFVVSVVEQQRSSYLMEILIASLLCTVLTITGYTSFFSSGRSGVLHQVEDRSVNVVGASLDNLYLATLLMATGIERPRCVAAVPIALCSLCAVLVGAFSSRASDVSEALDGPFVLRRDLQVGVFSVLCCFCMLFRVVREKQHRKHFHQYATLFARRELIMWQHEELVRISERFVPLERAPTGLMKLDRNPMSVCFVVEITTKEFLLPRDHHEVTLMSRMLIKLERNLRQATEGCCVERIFFDGDTFYCSSGLEHQVDALGTRTFDMVTVAFKIIRDAASKWKLFGADSAVECHALNLRAGLHTGSLTGCAIGRSTFHYMIAGECLAVAKWIVGHANSNQLIITRAALEACGGKPMKVVPLRPIECIDAQGSTQRLSTYYVTSMEESEDDISSGGAAEGGGAIFDLLLTPQFADAAQEDKKDGVSVSALTEYPERSVTVNAVTASAVGNNSFSAGDGIANVGVVGSDGSAMSSPQRRPKHFFYDAMRREGLISEQLRREVRRLEISSDGILTDEFVELERERHFLRTRSSWHASLRLSVLVMLGAMFFSRAFWRSVCKHVAAGHHLPPPPESDAHAEGPMGDDLTNAEFAVWVGAMACFATRGIVSYCCLNRRTSLWPFQVWKAETTLLGSLLFVMTLHAYMGVSTWTRRVPSLLWILLLCLFYSHIPFRSALFLCGCLVTTAVINFSVMTNYWRVVDIAHIAAMSLFYMIMCRTAERQDRQFYRDSVISKAASQALRRKQAVLSGVLRATIPSLLHTYHRSMPMSRRPGANHSSAGHVVVIHDRLVISLITWKGFSPQRGAFDRVASIEKSIQAANEILDFLLHGHEGGCTGSSSESEADVASSTDTSAKPSLCIVRCLGDIVTVAGLPAVSVSRGAASASDSASQVAALVAAVLYAWMYLLTAEAPHTDGANPATMSAMLSTGTGASTITYDEEPNYAVFGGPLTEVIALLQAVSGGYLGVTAQAAHALRQRFPSDVLTLGTLHNETTSCRIGPEKRWRVKGVGSVDLHLVTPLSVPS